MTSQKRKLAKKTSQDSAIGEELSDDSCRSSLNNSGQTENRPIWITYNEFYKNIKEVSKEASTADEWTRTTRTVNTSSAQLAHEVQKLDLISVDHWETIAEILIKNWEKIFSVPENHGWSISELVPLNRCKSVSFPPREMLLKRKSPQESSQNSQKKRKVTRRDENKAKVSKPLQGLFNDKPLPLIEHMKRVTSALKNNCNSSGYIEYFKLVLNPESFSLTVYNIFTISFLLREGLVDIKEGKDGQPLVSAVPESRIKKKDDFDQGRSHFIIDLTTNEWETLIKKLKIRQPLISWQESNAENDSFYERFTESMSQKENSHRRRL